MLNSDLSSHPQLTKLEQTGTNENPYYIYENTDALPVGFVAASSIKSWQPVQYNPIASQNSLFASLTGNADELFALAATAVDPDSGMNGSTGGGTSFSVNPGTASRPSVSMLRWRETGQAFVYIDRGAAKSISVSSGSNTWSVSPREPFIIDAGSLSAGDTVTVSVTAESSCTAYLCRDAPEGCIRGQAERAGRKPLCGEGIQRHSSFRHSQCRQEAACFSPPFPMTRGGR